MFESKELVNCKCSDQDPSREFLLNLCDKIDSIFVKKLQDPRLTVPEDKLRLYLKYLEVLKEINKELIKMVLIQESEDENLKEIEQLKGTVNKLRETIKEHTSKSLCLQDLPRRLDQEVENPIIDLCRSSDSETQVDFDADTLEQEILERKRVKNELEETIKTLFEESEILCHTNQEFKAESNIQIMHLNTDTQSLPGCSSSSTENLFEQIQIGYTNEIEKLEAKLREECEKHQIEMKKKSEQIEMLSGKLEKYRNSLKCYERENEKLREDLKHLNEAIENYDSYREEHYLKKKQNKVKKIFKITEETFDGDRTSRKVVVGTSSKSPGKRGEEVKLDPQHLENYM